MYVVWKLRRFYCGRPSVLFIVRSAANLTIATLVAVSSLVLTPRSSMETSRKATASFVFGFFSWVPPAAIAAVILGHISRAEIRRSAGRVKGARFALTGLILGYIGLAAVAVLIIGMLMHPKITKAQIPAHEASAIASIKAINAGQMIYSSSHPGQGFAPDFAILGGTTESGGEQANNPASRSMSGYTFTYTPGEKVNGAIRSYTVTAVPDQVGSTGQRRFFSDESGEIHYNAFGPADATSPVIQ